MTVAKGIISEEQAKEYDWLEKPYRENNFLERYNKHQLYLNNEGGGEKFVALADEILPKYLSGADLIRADLSGADLSGAVLSNSDLSKAKIDAVSLLKETAKWNGVDFTNVELHGLENIRSRIIQRMVELKITDAKGLGDGYKQALEKAGLVTSEAEIAPHLARAGFEVVANMPTPKQIEELENRPVVTRSLEI